MKLVLASSLQQSCLRHLNAKLDGYITITDLLNTPGLKQTRKCNDLQLFHYNYLKYITPSFIKRKHFKFKNISTF